MALSRPIARETRHEDEDGDKLLKPLDPTLASLHFTLASDSFPPPPPATTEKMVRRERFWRMA